MDKVFATLRTFGVLLGIWVILVVVGIATGVIPLHTFGIGSPDEPEEATSDAGVAELDGGVADADGGEGDAEPADEDGADEAPVDGDETPSDGREAPAGATRGDDGARWAVCPASGADPSVSVGELFGGGAPEIAVGCPDGWHVIGIGPRGPYRVARFTVADAPRDQRARTGAAAYGDVDGDGKPDLVLPLAYESDNGATRGGALHWVPGSPYGGIREPVNLAPIAAFAVTIGALDNATGADVAAVNRANALAQLDSEVWAFGGGAAPARMQALPLGVVGAAVAITDLDRDRRADVIGLSRGRVDLYFGDGAGGFERNHTLELPNAREIGVGDLDEDGAPDLVVLGGGIQWIRAGALDGMEPRGLDGVPTNLRGMQVLDTNADAHVDIAGWDHPRLFVMRWRAEVDFEPTTGVTLVGGTFGPRRHAMADLDADGAADDLVLIGTAGGDAPQLELVMIHDATDPAELTLPTDARALPDAPLLVEAALR